MVNKSENPKTHNHTVIELYNAEFFDNIYPYKNECDSIGEGSK